MRASRRFQKTKQRCSGHRTLIPEASPPGPSRQDLRSLSPAEVQRTRPLTDGAHRHPGWAPLPESGRSVSTAARRPLARLSSSPNAPHCPGAGTGREPLGHSSCPCGLCSVRRQIRCARGPAAVCAGCRSSSPDQKRSRCGGPGPRPVTTPHRVDALSWPALRPGLKKRRLVLVGEAVWVLGLVHLGSETGTGFPEEGHLSSQQTLVHRLGGPESGHLPAT